MKHWLRIFLPIWALGTIAWMTTGFALVPDAFRKPLFYSTHGVWVTNDFDPTHIDMEVARALAVVIGPPLLAGFVAVLVLVFERFRRRSDAPRKV